MSTITRAALVCGLTAVLGATGVVGTANATPGVGVTSRLISQNTANGTDYIIREITLAPGGSTGWHYHDGTLYARVREGTLTHTASTCKQDGLYKKGDLFTEPSGSEHVHVGRNLGKDPVVLDVLYVDPAGKPLSEDAPDPACPGIK
jgi:quercetin dioxygenase-like cupin family protein